MLPISSKVGEFRPIDALFTATSATCVTGLVVGDTFTLWTPFGQGVILVLIQLGGLGLSHLDHWSFPAGATSWGFGR